ncbi:MAG: 2-amino-4-hydroxy-6-hydroxymethyldihydropteridine diphosphokinase [Bacillota bacterium]|nr:2-amino-4-hydroxy-6-hydroxymethyldihydropteridine diphosphokinase [Bacillota bacterium]
MTAYIGIGSNLPSQAGLPAETIEAAIVALRQLGTVVARSSLYETEPVGYQDQPSFMNAVAALESELSPEELLENLLSLERRFGRDRNAGIPKGPRTLDLDLLLAGDWILKTPMLTLPHPALEKRRFVLVPLAEIAPELRHPILKKTIRELLQELPEEEGVRLLGR